MDQDRSRNGDPARRGGGIELVLIDDAVEHGTVSDEDEEAIRKKILLVLCYVLGIRIVGIEEHSRRSRRDETRQILRLIGRYR